MRSFQVIGQGTGIVRDIAPPAPGPGQVVIDVSLVGICGTDVSLFHGDAARLEQSRASYPLQLGHEWTGTVRELGAGVDPSWLGQRVVGDSMIGCGTCQRCRDGRHFVCEERYEVGVRGGWAGALAEKFVMPVASLFRLPDTIDDAGGALVEPGANSYRAFAATQAGRGDRVLVLGPGTIGLLCAAFALDAGCEVHMLGRSEHSLESARALGVAGAWTRESIPSLAWDAVIDATDSPEMPAVALEFVEPGRRVAFVGISHTPSPVDSRLLVFKDVTAVGILGGSLGIAPTIAAYASGAVDPTTLVRATIGLDDVARALDGWVPEHAAGGSKILVDPRR